MNKLLPVFIFLICCINIAPVNAQTFINPISANSFKTGVTFNTGNYPVAVTVKDIDGDGKPDMIIANEGSNSVSVYLNGSTGGSITNASFATKIDFALTAGSGSGPESVIANDIDGDGKPDLLITSFNGSSVAILRNTSSPGSVSFAPEVDFYIGNSAHSLSAGDIDGDGKPDLVIADYNTGTVSLLRNVSSTGSVAFATPVLINVTGNLSFVAIKDMDGDSKPDLIVAIGSQNLVSVYHNSFTGGTIDANTFTMNNRHDLSTGVNPYALAIADFDGDGLPDIAVANEGSNTVSIFRNMSSGGNALFSLKVDFITGYHPNSIAVADIDGDGKPDIVVSNWYTSGTLSILQNGAVSGSITTTSFGLKTDVAAGQNPQCVTFADLDGDGLVDLIAANSTDYTLSVLQNQSGNTSISGTYPESTASVSLGSFVNTNLMDTEWSQDIPAGYSAVSDDGTTINTAGNAGANAGRFVYFATIGSQTPFSAINGNLTFTAKGSGTIEVQILAAYNLSVAARQTFTLTSNFQDYSWVISNLYPKLEYIIAVVFNGGNSSSQASAQFKKNFCLNLHQGGMAGNFTRYRADLTSLIGNSETAWYGRSYSDALVHKKYLQHSAYARMRFNTNATHIVIEYVRDFYDKTILNLFPTPYFQTNADWGTDGNITTGYNAVNTQTPVTPGKTYTISGLLTTNPTYVWFHNGAAMGAAQSLTNLGTATAPLYQLTAPANADHLGLLIVRMSDIYNFLDPVNDTFNSFVNCQVEEGAIGAVTSFGTVPNAFLAFGGFTPSYISGPAIFINGNLYQYYQVEGTDVAVNVQFLAVDLPPGQKDVEIMTTGQTAGVDPTVQRGGYFLRAVYVPSSNTTIYHAGTAATGSICYIHDSILSGFVISSDAQNNVWMMKVKHDPSYSKFTGDVFSEGYGSRFLYTDTQTPVLLEAFAQKLASFGVDKYWFEVGSKDYQLGIPLFTYYSEYKTLIERLKVLRPNAKIYVQCGPPFLAEGPNPETISDNGLALTGPTLNDFRDAQRAIAKSHSYCEYVDFEGLFPAVLANLPDGLHPSDAGNQFYANGIRDKSTLLGTVLPVTPLAFYRPSIRPLIQGAATISIVTATGGTAPYVFTIQSGTLPSGVTFNTDGTFTGVPTQNGTFPLRVQVTDANSTTISETINLIVNGTPYVVAAPIHILNAVLNTPYSKVLRGAGGYGPYTLAETGSLPAGMTYDTSSGTFSGTPSSTGTYTFTISATDHYGFSGTTNYTFTVGTVTPTPLSDQFYQTIDISTGHLVVTGHLNDLYSQDLSTFIGGYVTQGGVETLVGSGTGLTVQSGHFDGTPVNLGTINMSNGPVTSVRIFTAVISPSTVDGVTINYDANNIIPIYLNANQGSSFSQSLLGALAYGHYTLTETGSLPAGLTFDPSTGLLSGTPTTSGTSTFSVSAVDIYGFTANTNYTIIIAPPAAFTYALYEDALENGWVNYSYNTTVDPAETTYVLRGTYGITATYTSGYGIFSLAGAGGAVSTTGLTQFKFSIYGGTGTNGRSVAVILNNDYSYVQYVTIAEGAWTNVSLPLSDFGTPGSINQIMIQEANGVVETVYLDDIGFN